MNNSKAIAASVAMVMASAIGTGGLVVWQQSSAAAPDPSSEATEVVVEFVDASADIAPEADVSSTSEAKEIPEEAGAEADTYEEDDEAEDYEDGDEAEDYEDGDEAEDYEDGDEAEDYEDGDEAEDYEDGDEAEDYEDGDEAEDYEDGDDD